jgi:hypothetical protein
VNGYFGSISPAPTVTHQPYAYVLQSRLILGIRQVSHVDRHITAVATFVSTARGPLKIVAAMMAPCSAKANGGNRGSRCFWEPVPICDRFRASVSDSPACCSL